MAFRIVLADDHTLVRGELRRLIEAEEGWLVCGEAETGEEAVRLCDELRPDVVVLDISLPLTSGLEAAKRIRQIAPDIAVIVVSVHVNEVLMSAALEAGARGYISKSEAPDHLVPAIRALLGSQATYFPSGRQAP